MVSLGRSQLRTESGWNSRVRDRYRCLREFLPGVGYCIMLDGVRGSACSVFQVQVLLFER
jgi:hypothetical protein